MQRPIDLTDAQVLLDRILERCRNGEIPLPKEVFFHGATYRRKPYGRCTNPTIDWHIWRDALEGNEDVARVVDQFLSEYILPSNSIDVRFHDGRTLRDMIQAQQQEQLALAASALHDPRIR